MAAVTIDELEIADDAAAWAALGFDVEDDVCRVGTVLVRLAGREAGLGILGWSLRGIEQAELDGLLTHRSPSSSPPASAGEHPNGVIVIDHVVAMTPALDRTVAALQAAGLDLRRIREEPTAAGAPRQAFFRLGEVILEVVQEPQAIVERDGGAERPARFWGLALSSGDLDATVASMAPHAGEPRDAVQPGRRIATLARSAGLALPVALMSAVVPAGAPGR
jgi:hypothetical protein